MYISIIYISSKYIFYYNEYASTLYILYRIYDLSFIKQFFKYIVKNWKLYHFLVMLSFYIYSITYFFY